MFGKVIYKKEYPRDSFDNLVDEGQESVPEEFESGAGMEFLKKSMEEMVYVLMPGKVERCIYFLEEVVDAAEYHKLDVVIKEYVNHIAAELCMECFANVSMLRRAVMMADEVSFAIKDDRVVMILDYYTHAAFQSGRRMPPFNI